MDKIKLALKIGVPDGEALIAMKRSNHARSELEKFGYDVKIPGLKIISGEG